MKTLVRKSRKKKTVKMLFIGNSFTARSDLPGGASLQAHWNAGQAAFPARLDESGVIPESRPRNMPCVVAMSHGLAGW